MGYDARETESTYAEVATNTYSDQMERQSCLCFVHVDWTADATVGNRLITLQVTDDAGNVRFDAFAGANITASQNRHVSFQPGIYRETSFVNNEIQVAIPPIVLEPGWTIKVFDTNDVSASDTFHLSYQFRV